NLVEDAPEKLEKSPELAGLILQNAPTFEVVCLTRQIENLLDRTNVGVRRGSFPQRKLQNAATLDKAATLLN
ncbi:MAG: hypothetical protein ABEJ66_02530, partial [Candidatus Nanohaloarchaea archaeon]